MSVERTWSESADFVGRFKTLHESNASLASSVPSIPLPSIVQARLNATNLTWTSLPPYAQLALLWDSGAVLATAGGTDVFLQVYVRRANVTMADIMPPFANSTSSLCKDPKRQDPVNFTVIDAQTRCAIAFNATSIARINASAWSQGAASIEPSTLSLRVFGHTDPKTNRVFPSIHSIVAETPQGACPSSRPSQGLIIPCVVFTGSFVLPAPSAAMTSWLSEIRSSQQANISRDSTQSSDPNALSWGIFSAVLAVLVVVVAVLHKSWMRRASPPGAAEPVEMDVFNLMPQSVTSQPRMPRSPSQAHYGSQQFPPHDPAASTLAILAEILSGLPGSMHLNTASVTCDHLVASTAHWEVHYGFFDHRPVAIKTLPTDTADDKLGRASKLLAFAREVRVMAAVSHPNIVAFVGFVWSPGSAAVVSAVAEYMAQGTLASFLADNAPMQWRIKASVALDVALALQYLHFVVNPTVVHRNLTSKNVLVQWPHVKLSCFGLSRHSNDDDAATFVPDKHHFYSAPEVLRSDAAQTSIASDMYSFGCVLAEIDTQAPLYANLGMPPDHIVYKIVRHGLRPAVLESCPEPIRWLVDRCLATDPSDRPTAMDAVHHLQSMLRSEVGYSQLV